MRARATTKAGNRESGRILPGPGGEKKLRHPRGKTQGWLYGAAIRCIVGVAMKRRFQWNFVLLLSVGVAGGCSSSQMSRIDRNRDIYETWPIEVRQAVLDGKVEPGMTSDMVRVAWGEPSEVVTQSASSDEIWVYKRGRATTVP